MSEQADPDPNVQPPLPLPESEPVTTEVTVTTEVQAVPMLATTEITPEVRPQYVPRLTSVPPPRRRERPDWVFWIWESRGVTYSYDIIEWSVRVGFLALGLLL